jgi:hypothetical protein
MTMISLFPIVSFSGERMKLVKTFVNESTRPAVERGRGKKKTEIKPNN